MASQLSDYPKSILTSLKKRQLKNQRYNNKKKLLLENNNNTDNDTIIKEDTTNLTEKKQSYNEIKNAKRRAETAAKPKCQGIKKDKKKCEKASKENGFCDKHQPKVIPIETFCEGYIPEKVIANEEQPYTPKKCDAKTKNNDKYCGKHIKLFGSLSLEEIEKIKNGQAKICSKTMHWHFGESAICDKCSILNIKYRNDHKLDPEEMAAKKCKWFDNNDGPCGRYAINNTDCCGCHDYAVEYTPEMIKNATHYTGGCRKLKYLGNFKTCDYCRNAGKKARTKHAENKIICKGTIKNKPCPFEAKINGYCGKHSRQMWKNDIEKDGTNKVCAEYKRGCFNVLNVDYKYSRCDDCRREERENEDPYKTYLKSATRRQIHWELTEDEVINFSKQNCYYCGVMNEKGFNGMDRKDNDKEIGYRMNNVVPCCSICNFMKQKIDSCESFIEYCINISNNCDNSAFYKEQSHEYINKKINKAKYKCKKVTRSYELSFDQTKQLVEMTCFYCNNTNSEKIGIDRYDPCIGYEISNCESCCNICNFLKWKFPVYVFFDRISRIYRIHNIDVSNYGYL